LFFPPQRVGEIGMKLRSSESSDEENWDEEDWKDIDYEDLEDEEW
jgi:hypothetical protein